MNPRPLTKYHYYLRQEHANRLDMGRKLIWSYPQTKSKPRLRVWTSYVTEVGMCGLKLVFERIGGYKHGSCFGLGQMAYDIPILKIVTEYIEL